MVADPTRLVPAVVIANLAAHAEWLPPVLLIFPETLIPHQSPNTIESTVLLCRFGGWLCDSAAASRWLGL